MRGRRSPRGTSSSRPQEGIELFARGRLGAAALLTAVALLALGLGTLPLRQRLSSEESNRRQMQTRPGKPSDLGPWFVVSLMAGFTEEIVYRGVMFTLLYWLTGSWWIAALLAVLVFSVSHATQGLPRAVFVGILAFGLHVLVRLTGALLLATIVHFLLRLLRGRGLRAPRPLARSRAGGRIAAGIARDEEWSKP